MDGGFQFAVPSSINHREHFFEFSKCSSSNYSADLVPPDKKTSIPYFYAPVQIWGRVVTPCGWVFICSWFSSLPSFPSLLPFAHRLQSVISLDLWGNRQIRHGLLYTEYKTWIKLLGNILFKYNDCLYLLRVWRRISRGSWSVAGSPICQANIEPILVHIKTQTLCLQNL